MARDGCVTIPGYGRPGKLAPRWYVGYLTFKGGNPSLPRDSLTGGGVIPQRQLIGTFLPTVKNYAASTADLVGGGSLIGNEPGLLALLAPKRGNGI